MKEEELVSEIKSLESKLLSDDLLQASKAKIEIYQAALDMTLNLSKETRVNYVYQVNEFYLKDYLTWLKSFVEVMNYGFVEDIEERYKGFKTGGW